jgi:hypothetical protein
MDMFVQREITDYHARNWNETKRPLETTELMSQRDLSEGEEAEACCWRCSPIGVEESSILTLSKSLIKQGSDNCKDRNFKGQHRYTWTTQKQRTNVYVQGGILNHVLYFPET